MCIHYADDTVAVAVEIITGRRGVVQMPVGGCAPLIPVGGDAQSGR